ncbi:MAG: GNAT family N-acetyltransferase [Candidatus Binatia bacterium]
MPVIRPYCAGDEQAILQLFRTVFQRELSLDAWRWKYQRNGEPPPVFVAEEEGQLVCHYGALREPLIWEGEERRAWNIVDVMCHPRYQGRGLFRKAAKAFIRRLCENRGLLIYGFPGERHRKLGELVIGYEPIAPVYRLRKPVPEVIPPLPGEVIVDGPLPVDWDARWSRLEARFAMVCRRDRHHLGWRYLVHPSKRYRLLTVRQKAAFSVVGIEGEKAYLMEFLLESEEPAEAARLLAAVESIARSEGASEIEGWFAPFAWESRFLAGPGGFSGDHAAHYVECQLFDPRLSAAWLAENFYYSLGDYDVF